MYNYRVYKKKEKESKGNIFTNSSATIICENYDPSLKPPFNKDHRLHERQLNILGSFLFTSQFIFSYSSFPHFDSIHAK